jgi:PAS domain S-box-containing protein
LPVGKLEHTTAECNAPIHPDDLPELLRREADTVAGKTDLFDCAYRARKGDQGWYWLMDRGRVSERDENGLAIRVSGVTLDIDEAKRRERELQDQRLRLDLALDASQLGLWDFDVVRDEVFVDQRYIGIVGLSAETLRHQYTEFERHVHEEDRQRLHAAGTECLEGRSDTLGFEGRLLKPDGRMIWIRIEGFVVSRQPDGQPARMIGTIADVSERLREQQLTRAGERVAGLGSYEFEVGADRAYWSEGTYRIFEFPRDFIPTRDPTHSLFPPLEGTAALDALRAAEQAGREFDIEAKALTAQGRRIWVRMIGRVESFRGKPVRVFGIVQDVTKRRTLEAELLEAANREQQKLGSDLHDGLGQELTGISLLLQGLGQQVNAANPVLTKPFDRISSLLSSAIRNTRSLAHGLAPVSFGRGGLEGALRILAEQATASYSVSVTFEVDPGKIPRFGEVAGNHIYRIVQEALSNAIRHGRAKTIRIRLAPAANHCLLDITDDGCGIDTHAAQGDGLGLRSMTYRAQAIGGTLSVERAPGGGTRVRLSCPQPAA